MKKLLLVVIIACPVIIWAQTDTLKVEQYCDIAVTGEFFSKKVTIDIDYGQARTWKTNNVKNADGTAKKFNTLVDALNYLGKQGWKLIVVLPDSAGVGQHFLFKKEFLKSQVEGDSN